MRNLQSSTKLQLRRHYFWKQGKFFELLYCFFVKLVDNAAPFDTSFQSPTRNHIFFPPSLVLKGGNLSP